MTTINLTLAVHRIESVVPGRDVGCHQPHLNVEVAISIDQIKTAVVELLGSLSEKAVAEFLESEYAIDAAVAEEREAIAEWYDTEGYLLDESDITTAIRERGMK